MNKSDFQIPKNRIQTKRSRSSGAGGQHVNKVETKIELRFELMSADWIPTAVRSRVATSYATRINSEGEFIVTCDETRSLVRNEELCYQKLRELILACWTPPKKRIKTKPTKGSQRRRVEEKKQVGSKKKNRKAPGRDD